MTGGWDGVSWYNLGQPWKVIPDRLLDDSRLPRLLILASSHNPFPMKAHRTYNLPLTKDHGLGREERSLPWLYHMRLSHLSWYQTLSLADFDEASAQPYGKERKRPSANNKQETTVTVLQPVRNWILPTATWSLKIDHSPLEPWTETIALSGHFSLNQRTSEAMPGLFTCRNSETLNVC